METRDERPQPDALLAEARKEGRGRLKIFIGAAPGVGKTYAMLEEAQRRRRDGIDVVVGIVETHGRKETEALVAGLEMLPRRLVTYRGRPIAEFDAEAAIRRRPHLLLVDELAHSNVPGSTHLKRWQDVEDILEAGIDVYSTLNIQHIESLNDVIARISGVRVRETLPDLVIATADDIELIDLPPDELIQRLRQGKVYVQEQIAHAIQNFFSKGNLTALRELAMRIAADRVDAEMTQHMQRHAIAGPWPTQERLLVPVNESPAAAGLLRAAKRMADRSRAAWIAVNVLRPGSDRLDESEQSRLNEAMKLAEELGAETVTLNAEGDVADELLRFARARNVSRLVIARPRPRRPWSVGREPVARRLLAAGADFEITLVAPERGSEAGPPLRRAKLFRNEPLGAYLWALAVTAAACGVAFALDALFPVASLSLIFVTGVVVIAVNFGLGPSLLASLLSFALYNFFFTEPYQTFLVNDRGDILTLLLFLVVALVTGNLAARVRNQAIAQRLIARRTENLFAFSRKVASAASADDVLWAAVHHVASTLQCRTIVLLPGADGQLAVAGGYPPEDSLTVRDRSAADWSWQHGEAAGWSTATLPTSDWLFLPLGTARGIQGVLGVAFDAKAMTPEQRSLLHALADQVAVVLDRIALGADLERTRLSAESEKLRGALLSSVSHDLRTPLVTIIGAAATLQDSAARLGPVQTRQLAETIQDEGQRLNRYVQNLLDMTRLGYGELALRKEPALLGEILGRARRQLGRALAGHAIRVTIATEADEIVVDPILFEQVLVNVLDNAAKYAPAGSDFDFTAEVEGSEVVIAVEDQGPGIPPEERERVFDMFYRVNAADSGRAGTGLGLAICRGIVEAHDGRIRALARRDGGGARIELRLPRGTAS